MVVCPCREDAVGEKCPFLGWVDPPMCPRVLNIIFGLLRNRNELDDLLDMTKEKADIEEHSANTEENKTNIEQIRANIEHERANMEHDRANRMRTYLMISWFVFIRRRLFMLDGVSVCTLCFNIVNVGWVLLSTMVD
nr:hypothetical protein [Tanacetum cinerariifolium]